jgi:DNA topoisomerase-1
MKLIIVESPTKAKTIANFLPLDFKIESSYGHIRDLPKSRLGVDIENNFEPHYVIPQKAKKVVSNLKKIAAKAQSVILATDSDREGEAIAWHLTQALGLENSQASPKSPKTTRIVFHEITKKAINDALRAPREIDIHLVNAQQARRVLDRLVGYQLSPFLWKKVFRGLSAGRVQSVALMLIVKREEEIENFKPEIYWTIEALLKNKKEEAIKAFLYKINNQTIPKPGIKDQKEVEKILKEIKTGDFFVSKYSEKETKRNPLPPFITSTLQQEANRRLYFSAKQTMMLAQNLYENGFITYMRTDSVHLAEDALKVGRDVILNLYGNNYLPSQPQRFKNKSHLTQEAHEAIRPTNPGLLPSEIQVGQKEQKLYELIWRRFIASQMPPAIFLTQEAEIQCNKNYLFKANGITLKFDGFLKVWEQEYEEKNIPPLVAGEKLSLSKVESKKHSTEPPARYNEASLIKTLESYGIGRPSTYASIISVIQERNYVVKNKDRRLEPTETGRLVNKILVENFPQIVDVQFTAKMEEDLDKIALGKKDWHTVVREFYEPFSQELENKYKTLDKKNFIQEEMTNEKCEKCGRPMVIKMGRFGKFLACSGFPECKNTKPLPQSNLTKETLGKCPKCKEGEIVVKKTRKGRIFYGCSNYPNCDWSSWQKPQKVSED